MTENDKKAKVGDCFFLLLAKFPSGKIHAVNIPSRELREIFYTRNKFEVFETETKGITFEPIL